MKIGMTGGIGSGKNEAATIFEELGFYTIDSDRISRKVMDQGMPAYEKIIEHFGNDITTKDGALDRKKLGGIVFANPEKRKILEQIVQPEIFQEEKRQINTIKSKDDKALIIVHAPLMVESGSYKNYDILIVVYAETEMRIQRVAKRDGISPLQAKKIIDTQFPEEDKLNKAHIIIENSGSKEDLREEVIRAANLIKQMVYGIKHP